MRAASPNSARTAFCGDSSRGAPSARSNSHIRPCTDKCSGECAATALRIRPKLEYANSLECYNASVGEWRARMPHACRAKFRRTYRQLRWRTRSCTFSGRSPAVRLHRLGAHVLAGWSDGVGPGRERMLVDCAAIRALRCSEPTLESIGFDPTRIYVCVIVITFGIAAVFFLAGVTTFSRFTDNGIEIRPRFHSDPTSTTTPASAQSSIARRFAPNGNTVPRPHFVILFDDHTSWSMRKSLRDPVPDLDSEIARLVSHQSRRRSSSNPQRRTT